MRQLTGQRSDRTISSATGCLCSGRTATPSSALMVTSRPLFAGRSRSVTTARTHRQAQAQAQTQSKSTRERTLLAHCVLAFVLNLEAADLELPAVGPARLVRMLPPLLDLREQLVGHKGKHCPLQDNALFRGRRTTKEHYGVTGLENNCRQGIQIALYAGTSE